MVEANIFFIRTLQNQYSDYFWIISFTTFDRPSATEPSVFEISKYLNLNNNFLTYVTGYESTVRLLIENGADVNIVNNFNNTALILAISEGFYLKIVIVMQKMA